MFELDQDAVDAAASAAPPLHLAFYLPQTSPHLSPLIAALAARGDVASVTTFVQEGVPSERIALGWDADAPITFDQHIGLDAAQQRAKMAALPRGTVHLFLGLRRVPCIARGLRYCQVEGWRFAIIHEPRVREGFRGRLRWLQSWLTEGRIRQRAMLVFAIGAHGAAWFRSTGYRPGRIVPFAYFIPPRDPPPVRAPRRPTIAYVGRLVPEKGFADFLTAVDALGATVDAVIAGAGVLADSARAMADANPHIRFEGVVPMARVPILLEAVDILIQPSHTTDDGWGVIVSEALLCGAAAITSDVVGASICLQDPIRGRTIPPRHPAAIAQAVTDLIESDALKHERRIERHEWAGRNLVADVGAGWMMAKLRMALAMDYR